MHYHGYYIQDIDKRYIKYLGNWWNKSKYKFRFIEFDAAPITTENDSGVVSVLKYSERNYLK